MRRIQLRESLLIQSQLSLISNITVDVVVSFLLNTNLKNPFIVKTIHDLLIKNDAKQTNRIWISQSNTQAQPKRELFVDKKDHHDTLRYCNHKNNRRFAKVNSSKVCNIIHLTKHYNEWLIGELNSNRNSWINHQSNRVYVKTSNFFLINPLVWWWLFDWPNCFNILC